MKQGTLPISWNRTHDGLSSIPIKTKEFIRRSSPVTEKMRENILRWYFHIERREESYMVKQVLNIDKGKRG